MRLGIADGFQMVVGPGQKVTELIMGKTTRGIRSLKESMLLRNGYGRTTDQIRKLSVERSCQVKNKNKDGWQIVARAFADFHFNLRAWLMDFFLIVH